MGQWSICSRARLLPRGVAPVPVPTMPYTSGGLGGGWGVHGGPPPMPSRRHIKPEGLPETDAAVVLNPPPALTGQLRLAVLPSTAPRSLA